MNPGTTVLTGDRPTGALHLGHYVGSLKKRVELQDTHTQYILVADMQALTDNTRDIGKVRENIHEVVRDYLAVGIDPKKTTICLQSHIPELAEMTMYYLNLVTVSRLQQNPTIKDEINQKGFGTRIPAGFLIYPISQASDITAFKADIVPVGADQSPMVEQTNDIVQSFNSTYNCSVLVEAKILFSTIPRLSGLDGSAKMSKSLNNAIYLKDDDETVRKKVMSAYTDQNHIKVKDPGKVIGNVVFSYLDAFCADPSVVNDLKKRYEKGGLGDVEVKTHLVDVLLDFLKPIQKRRKEVCDKDVINILKEGTERARSVASNTLQEMKKAMGMYI